MKYRFVLIIFLSIFINQGLLANDIEKNRKVVRTFKASAQTVIQINNKYGNIHMIPWTKDSVRFEIDINITGNKESKVERIDDGIDFDFTHTRYYVIARTVFSNSMNNLWSDLSDLTNTLFSSGSKAMINYTVYFPASSPVKIENKFGNVYTTDHKAAVEINLSNGNLKAHDFQDELVLELQFGNASVNKVHHGRFELGYGEFEFEQVGEVDFSGKSAELSIGKAGFINLNSRRDEISIKQLGGLSGYTSFSDLDIGLLTDEALISTRYGEFFVDGFGDAFRLLDLNSEYTDLRIGGISEVPVDAILIYDDRTQTIFSEPIKRMKSSGLEDDEDKIRKSGKTSSTASRYARIRIRLTGGSLSI